MHNGNQLIRFIQLAIFKVLLLLPGMFCFTYSFSQTDSLKVLKAESVLIGKTQGLLPHLKYGPGTDRLGGAKMTYPDTAIMVQVIDSMKDDYILRLSKNHHAFMSNQEDEKRIIDPKFQRDVAKKIRNGINDWLRKL